MNAKKLILLVFMWFELTGYAQVVRFNRSYVLPPGSDLSDVYSIITKDSLYLCIGITKSSYVTQSLMFFVLDKYGMVISDKEIGYQNISYVMPPESYCKNQDTVYFGCLRNNYNFNPVHKEVMLYKFYNSDTIFKKKIFTDTVASSAAPCVNIMSDIYFVGWDTELNNTDYMLLKTDISGNHVWEKLYGGISGEAAYQIINTTDSCLLMSGESFSFGNNSPYDNGQWYVVKVDTGGNVIWQHTYGNPNLRDYAPKGLIETADSCYIITGSYTVGMSGSTEMLRGRILKIDPNGNIVWSKLYGHETEETYIGITKQKSNGNFVSILHDGINSIGYFVVVQELTPTGDLLWFRRYKYSIDPYGYSVLNSFDFTSDGGYIFAGYGTDYDSVPAQRSWVIKTDSLGFDGVTDFSADTTFRIEVVSDSCYGDTVRVVTHTYGITAPYSVAYEGYGVHDSLYYSPLYEPYIADTLWLTASQLTGSDTVVFVPCSVTDGLGRVLHDTLQVDVSCLVNSISTQTAGDYLAVYPNPADDRLTVEYALMSAGKDCTIGLYDMQGHKLKSQKVKDVLGIITFDVSDLSNGTYIIKAGQFSKQIIIAH